MANPVMYDHTFNLCDGVNCHNLDMNQTVILLQSALHKSRAAVKATARAESQTIVGINTNTRWCCNAVRCVLL